MTPPTTQELTDNIVAQIDSSIGQTIPFLPKAFTHVLAKALAGVFILLWKYIGFMLLQQFVAHASMEWTEVNGKRIRPLVEWGRLFGVGDPKAASAAELVITVTVTNQTGSLPAGSQVLFPATQIVYTTKAAVALSAATVPVTIVASSGPDNTDGSGSIGNLQPGDKVEFANPLPNIKREAVVASQAVTGADGESTELYRSRVISRCQAKPQGGARADYRDWSEVVPGIVAVYPYAGDPGEVDVYVEASPESSGNEDGLPTAPQIDAVRQAIEFDVNGLASNRPVNAGVNVLPISRIAFDVNVASLDAPDVNAAKEALEQSVDELLRFSEPFITGLSVLPRRDRITSGTVAGAVDAAVGALGGTVGPVTLLLGGVPIVAYTLQDGEKAKLGAATYS